jgi:hypothetical protein
MIANDILLDAFTRVHESLHRTLGDISPEELIKEPPSFDRVACLAHQSSHGQQCLPAFRPRDSPGS